MNFESELRLLRETFEKCHVRSLVVSVNDPASLLFENGIKEKGDSAVADMSVRQCLGILEPKTLYRLNDEFCLCYRYLLLTGGASPRMLFIGPFLAEALTPRQLLELGERLRVSPKGQRYLDEYYAGIPILEESDRLLLMLDTFCEHIWGVTSFAMSDVKNEQSMPVSPLSGVSHEETQDDLLINMKTMEQRYAFENELMRAVSLGQLHKETMLLSAFTENVFEKRASDPLRNLKNYCIIMNTLLRKAAEDGGVHPMYIDHVSSDFAQKIEGLSSISADIELMRTMFRSYCRLVRKHSMKSFSRVVQKTVVLIDSDLSADLTLSSLAKSQGVSAGYLSTVFKKEMGKTVSEYIREKRIRQAEHLLATTHLQIQTVALHCGILDVQYFSKLFKRTTGKTPKEYRESLK